MATPHDAVLLPKNVVPSRYAVHFEPDLTNFTFHGHESVTLDVRSASPTVVLHARQLAVSNVSFTGSNGKTLQAVSISFDLHKQTVSLTFGQDLPLGRGELKLSFTGTLNDELAGLYRSKYVLRGETRYMAVTQFEATDARRAFPCVDEPASKAVFAVSVRAPADRMVISNMTPARVATAPDGKTKTWTFNETPVISTYLVALIVGEFDVVSAMRGGVVTSVFTPVGKSSSGNFALKVAVDSLAYLEQLFGVPYMGTKSDLLAIPDFAAGAMENLGCVTYREAALLVDEAESSLATKQRVAQVVAHELSHQWFGNLTTMQWWTHLWLNEGFAKHMEYVVTDHLFPEWDTFAHFTSQVQSAAFSLDAMATTHPIEVEVKHPDEINEIFDAISYNKGASVIRMLFAWLGHDVAFKGLTAYLTKFSHANALTEDLWDALAAASGKDVRSVMRAWTSKPGYPFLAVSRGGDGRLALSSRRFIAPWALAKGGDGQPAWPTASDFPAGPGWGPSAAQGPQGAESQGAEHDWCIPVSVVSGSGAASKGAANLGVLALDGAGDRAAALAATASALTDATAGAGWFKLNARHANFHRTVYAPDMLAGLVAAVSCEGVGTGTAPALGVADRLGLIADVGAAVSVGLVSAADLLPLAWAYRFETDYNVWLAVLEAVGEVKATAEAVSAEAGAAVTRFQARLLARVVARVGWDAAPGEHSNTPLLRALVLRAACLSGAGDVVEAALQRFDAYAAGRGTIPADLKQVVYNTAASDGGAARWERLLALFRDKERAGSSEEQRRLMTALGRAAGDAALLRRALDLTLVPDGDVRSQDAVFLVGSVASNPGPLGAATAWAFLRAHWATLHARYGGANFLWASMVGACVGHLDSKAAADEVTAWFADPAHPAGSAERKVAQSLEAVRSRVWRAHVMRNDPRPVAQAADALKE